MTADHPHVRKCRTCPVCGRDKDAGCVVCWHCYHEHDFRTGANTNLMRIIDQYEADLQRAQAPTELTPIGEQYVIPGCEKHERPKGSQLKLWEA